MPTFTNKFGLPEPIAQALVSDDYDKGKSNRSVTTLIDSPRVRILRMEHDHELEEDVSERMWSVLGRAVHRVFEQHTTAAEHISEERLFLERHGWLISGAIDLQELLPDGSVFVRDYKVTSVWSVIYDKVEWHNQLNAYAWLIRHTKGLRVSGAEIIAVLRDWKHRDAATKHDYPQSPIVTVRVPVWTEQKQDEYMERRIKLHQEAEFERLTGGRIPDCTDAETWRRAPAYAVKKGSNKRAVRVLPSMEAAQRYIADNKLDNKHFVETRPGEMVRCADNWCGVADHCDQYARVKKLMEATA